MDALGNRRSLRRLTAWLRRGRLERELADEIRHHLELRTRALIDDGMDPRDAAYEARRVFGNAAVIREEARDMWGYRWLDALVQDARFGVRLLRRSPLFTSVAVLSIAAGIGSAATVFTIADAVLYRPLEGVRAAAELRAFRIDVEIGGASKVMSGVPPEAFETLRQSADFADVIGFRTAERVNVERTGLAPTHTRVEFVTPTYFEVLGVRPSTGRPIDGSDGDGPPMPVVISERLWRAHFNGAAGVVGQPLGLNGSPAVVVGVVKQFRGVRADRPADVFAPLDMSVAVEPSLSQSTATLLARLRPGLANAEAEARLAAVYRMAMPAMTRGARVRATLEPAEHGIAGGRESLRLPLRMGLGLVAVLLLVACANTAGLLLSRVVARGDELALRVAIGAGRWRLARQLTVEALLVGVAASVIGIGIAWLGAPALLRIVPQASGASSFDLRIDGRVILMTAFLGVLCSLGAASASLVRVLRGTALSSLNPEARGAGRRPGSLGTVLVAAQVACTLLLLVGAASIARSITNLHDVPLGFDGGRLVFIQASAAGLADPRGMAAYHGALHQRLAAVPGVESATVAQLGLLTSSATVGTVDVAGFTPLTDEDRVARVFFVGADYFDTVRMPLVAGRSFHAHESNHVAVVNVAFARLYFGGPEQSIDQVYNRDVRIVGVVANAHYGTPRAERQVRAVFVPYAPAQRAAMTHIVRVAGHPDTMVGTLRSAIAVHDLRLRPEIGTAGDLLAAALSRERFFATIAAILAGLAILLASAGLYAAVGYAVSQRAAELSLRIALGASRRSIAALVLRGPVRTVLTGVLAGTPGVFFVMRSAESLLFGVPVFDPSIVVGSAVLLVVIGVAAAAWPARQATTIDPIAALKSS